MKTALLVFIGSLVGGGAMAAETPFSPPEQDFSIAFVAAPTAQSEFPGGKAAGGFRRYVAEHAGETFVLSVDQYPDHIKVPPASKGLYERLLWAHAHEANAAMSVARPAMLSNLPCWEATYKLAGGMIEVRRILMLGDSIYQLSDTHAEGTPAADEESFFASFKITASSLSRSRNVVGDLS